MTDLPTQPAADSHPSAPASPAAPGRRHPFEAAALAYTHALMSESALRYLPAKLYRRRGTGAIKLIQQLLASRGTPVPAAPPGGYRDGAGRKALRAQLARYLREAGPAAEVGATPLPEPLQRNLTLCASLLQLTTTEMAFLRLALVVRCHRGLRGLFECFKRCKARIMAQVVGAAIGATPQAVLGQLSQAGRLRQMKIMSRIYSHCAGMDLMELTPLFEQAILSPSLDRVQLIEAFVPRSPPADLSWQALAHAHSAAEPLRRLMRQALAQKASGINVLLYGDTGTGKTALARALAQTLGAPLYMAAFSDGDGESLAGASRVASYALAQRLIAPGTGLVLFDEFDEVLTGNTDGADQGGLSKNWLNTLLETNPVPALFITNDISEIDPAHLRRFAFVMEFGPAAVEVRQQAVLRHIEPSDDLSLTDVASLCDAYPLDPGHLTLAMRTCRLMEGRAHLPALRHILAPLCRLGAVSRRGNRATGAKGYDLDVVSSKANLPELTQDLVAAARDAPLRAALLLYGPPGTGKSAYLQHLAQQLGRPVVHRTAAELMGAMVGQTEKAIRRAFLEAQESQAVLVFDEVDGLLPQRLGSMRSWETTLVATFLQELEHFRGTVGCTTNHLQHLDAAALRRFTFKIEMAYPSMQQRLQLFGRMLAAHLDTPWAVETQQEVRQALSAMGPLTVGDFKVVAQQQALRGRKQSVQRLLAALAAEAGLRKPCAAPMGFVRGPTPEAR